MIRPVALLIAAIALSRPAIPGAEAARYAEALNEAAERHALDPLLMVAIAHFESRWLPGRVSEDGEDYGLGQVRARYVGACRDELDPLGHPGEACLAAKASLLDGVLNIRLMGGILAANRDMCRAKAGRVDAAHYLAGYQGLSQPEKNRWCQPGEKTRSVLGYQRELIQKLAPGRHAPVARKPATVAAPGALRPHAEQQKPPAPPPRH